MALPPRPSISLVDSGLMQGGPDEELPEIEVDIETIEDFEGGAEVIEDGEGGATIQALVSQMEEQAEELIEHEANLAEYLEDGYLGELSSELRASYEEDMDSRSEWEDTYTKGLDQLGIKQEERTQPFAGASGVTHPMIVESVTRIRSLFQLVVQCERSFLVYKIQREKIKLPVLKTL